MRTRRHVLAVLAAATGLLTACGGNPTGPSPSEGVVLDGTVVGGTAALAFHASAGSTAGADEIIVTCRENPAITTTVGTDGRFTLRGLPAGGFTLDFKQGTTSLGSLTFGDVKPNQEITIWPSISPATATSSSMATRVTGACQVTASEVKVQQD